MSRSGNLLMEQISWTTFLDIYNWDYWSCLSITIALFVLCVRLWTTCFGGENNNFGSLFRNVTQVFKALMAFEASNEHDKDFTNIRSYRLLKYAIIFFGTLNFYFFNAVLISHLTVTEPPRAGKSLNG